VAQVKRVRRNVNGIILLDKPRGFTSNAALQKVRWLLNAEKAGHTGSLDPLATGVLPLCFGEATKFSQYLLDADKAYETVMQLGVTTTTADAEGEVLERKPVAVTVEQLEALLPQFRGDILQVPPMYSALKRDGQPLYKLARAGEVVEREPRSVNIGRRQGATGRCMQQRHLYPHLGRRHRPVARLWCARCRAAANPGRAVRPVADGNARNA
jgi:tRNA pseudouridine55 synthase